MLLIAAILLFTSRSLCQQYDFDDPLDCAGNPSYVPRAMVSYNEHIKIFETDLLTQSLRDLKDGVPRLIQQKKLQYAQYFGGFAGPDTSYRLFKTGRARYQYGFEHYVCHCDHRYHECERNCTQTYDQFFKFLPNVFTQNPQSVISATDLDETSILVVFDDPNVMGVFSPDGHQLEPFVSYPAGKLPPLAMANIRQNGPQNVTLLLCFYDLCGEHQVNPRNLTTPLAPDRSRPYFSARLLLGCETDLCFDGSFDAATYVTRNDKSAMLLIRGNYLYELDGFQRNRAPPVGNILQHWGMPRRTYDAAFRTRTSRTSLFHIHYLICGDEIFYSRDPSWTAVASTENVATTFSRFRGHVDAALTLDNGTLLLLQGQVVYRYSPKPLTWSFVDKVKISYLHPNVPSNIEAALNNNGTLYFFKSSHYYTYNLESNMLTGPLMVQTNAYKCDKDGDYVGAVKGFFGINTMQQFVDYKKQFFDQPTTTTTIKPTTSTSTRSPTKAPYRTIGGAARSTHSRAKIQFLALVAGVLAGLLFLLLAAIYFLVLKKRLPGPENSKNRFPSGVFLDSNTDTRNGSVGYSVKENPSMGVMTTTMGTDNDGPSTVGSVQPHPEKRVVDSASEGED
ncbi:hypothetical protein HDE_13171 [Halotydeus destructor]|nr:hypothetical protein HDE_13171 [Halotydeus destructor]